MFPVFRKYSDGLTWFKIDSPENFWELKKLGNHYSLTHFDKLNHPGRLFVNDLIECAYETIESAGEDEYLNTLRLWEQTLSRFE